MGTQSQHHWKTRIMFLFAVLLLGVGIQAAPHAPQHSRSSYYQPKCSYQPKEACTTVYENVERKVTNVECHTEYGGNVRPSTSRSAQGTIMGGRAATGLPI